MKTAEVLEPGEVSSGFYYMSWRKGGPGIGIPINFSFAAGMEGNLEMGIDLPIFFNYVQGELRFQFMRESGILPAATVGGIGGMEFFQSTPYPIWLGIRGVVSKKISILTVYGGASISTFPEFDNYVGIALPNLRFFSWHIEIQNRYGAETLYGSDFQWWQSINAGMVIRFHRPAFLG
ncbi:hypothetical protein DRP53_05440 [candidate division WOR-3 bacterium]|uniref:Uncharacterized protein n=1 Tax=candidate division WOR-3 bacterium TaxID=2052148 RepID=A0A660SHM5_UNCW3|nr:MAG: hypothetical protein DRP53_05440 [candidate division WOR-3 bacterium]